MTYKLGIDVGSTTLKAVVLNDEDEIIFYIRKEAQRA